LISCKKIADCLDITALVETLLENRYAQVWVVTKTCKQSPVGWFFASFQQTESFNCRNFPRSS